MKSVLRFVVAAMFAGGASTSWAEPEVTVVATPEIVTPESRDCTGTQQQRLNVFVTPPEGSSISTAVFDIDYDAQRVAIPGRRNEESVRERFDGFPAESVSAINDQDGHVRVVVTGTKSLSRKLPLFTMRLDVCADAKAPAIEEYKCEVSSCAAMMTEVPGCTCRIEAVKSEP